MTSDQKRARILRGIKAACLRRQGHTYAEIGRLIGRVDDPSIPISRETASALVFTGKWDLEEAERELSNV